MFGHWLSSSRFSLVLCGFIVGMAGHVSAVSAGDVVVVEEHWELSVQGPDENRSSPQVSMVMSPLMSLTKDYFLVTLNHWTSPAYSAGGIQVQHWNGDDCLASANSLLEQSLKNDGEIVSWVQRISVADGQLRFEVVNGTSRTWGEFGDSDGLSITVPTSLSQLNQYRPALSMEESGIGYAGNRVSSLILKKIRWTTSSGETGELIAPIDIATELKP